VVVGLSGAGKSTLLRALNGLVPATSGSITIDGTEVVGAGSAELRTIRSRIGMIFQTFNLVHGYTCIENVLLGMSFGPGADRRWAHELLERVGLGQRLDYFPRQLSTGQQQRVAVARALANRPKLVLADEPTGNLDPASAAESLGLIRETCRENGAALLLVSHDREVLGQFDNVRDLADINLAAAWPSAKEAQS